MQIQAWLILCEASLAKPLAHLVLPRWFPFLALSGCLGADWLGCWEHAIGEQPNLEYMRSLSLQDLSRSD